MNSIHVLYIADPDLDANMTKIQEQEQKQEINLLKFLENFKLNIFQTPYDLIQWIFVWKKVCLTEMWIQKLQYGSGCRPWNIGVKIQIPYFSS